MQSLVTGEQAQQLAKLVENLSVEGEIWECGVYKGGTAKLLHDRQPKRVLRLFDTFGSGIPVATPEDNHHKVGDFAISENDFNTIVTHFIESGSVYIYKGVIPDVFHEYSDELDKCKIAFLHIDLDQYKSYKDTLDYCVGRMVDGGIVVFDDYGAGTCVGATKAVDEFIRNTEYKLNKNSGHGAWVQIT
jgi:O-methyltransferase